MNKKISLGAAIAFMLVVATVTLALTMAFSMNRFTTMVNGVQQQRELYSKLAEIEQQVRDKYPDAIDNDKLMDSMAAGYISGLGEDGGKYYTADAYQQLLTSEEGRYYGVGIVPVMEPSGYIQVKEVYPDSPASNAQIVVGDLIVKVDDLDVTTETYADAVKLLQGEAGTKVNLTVRRDNEDISMEITRRQVEIPTVYANTFDRVGYLRITSFTTGTRDQMNRQLNQAIGSNLDALVVDLRDNTGGRYGAMAPALELLVPEGDMILAKYKSSEPVVLADSDSAGVSFPLVVLTNANTSGTAEVFAQVLKDMTGARVVGTKTAGDGKIQEFVKLSDGSAIQLTVARYVTPSGIILDGEGVKPDYDVALEAETINWDYIDPEFDSQLKKALEVAQASVNVETAEQ
ncbi:MAG: PDZ domain-containing protein [Oscillospiraceae bacterium]|nr:PDZ domain-containing protein [Oscillospiraceae bacterium]